MTEIKRHGCALQEQLDSDRRIPYCTEYHPYD